VLGVCRVARGVAALTNGEGRTSRRRLAPQVKQRVFCGAETMAKPLILKGLLKFCDITEHVWRSGSPSWIRVSNFHSLPDSSEKVRVPAYSTTCGRLRLIPSVRSAAVRRLSTASFKYKKWSVPLARESKHSRRLLADFHQRREVLHEPEFWLTTGTRHERDPLPIRGDRQVSYATIQAGSDFDWLAAGRGDCP